MKGYKIFPIAIFAVIVALVPVIRRGLFFDIYLIKLWIAQIGTAALFIYFLYQILFKKAHFQTYGMIGVLLIGYLLINVVSWILIPAPYKYPSMLTLAAACFYILLCYLTAQYLKEFKIQSLAVLLWVIITAGICVFGLVQFFTRQRVIGTLGNENFLASHIGITIPVFAGFILSYIRIYKKSPLIVMLLIVSALYLVLLFLITLYLTHARGAWLGLIASLSCFLILASGKRHRRLAVFIILIVILTAGVFTPWGIRFISRQFQGDVRPAIWESSLYMITEKPLLGWGKGAYFIFYPAFRIQDYWLTRSPTDLTTHAHNEYLQIFAETGLIGLCVFMALVFFILRLGIAKADETRSQKRFLLLGFVCGIIGLLTHNLVCNNLQMPSSAIFLWIMFGIVISYSKPKPLSLDIGMPARYTIFLALALFMSIIIWQTAARPIISQYLFKEGTNFREKELWPQAIEKYKEGIEWYPWDVEMYYRMAYAYTMDGRYEEAIEKYNDVIRLAPLYGSAHKNMGIVYMKLGDYKEARRSFLQALRINEHDLVAHINLNKIKPRSFDYDDK